MDEDEGGLMRWDDFLCDANNEELTAASAANGMEVQDTGDPGAWNPCTLGALPDSWKLHQDERRRRNVNRLQDISVGLETNITATRQHDEWPFENSPCRLFRGRNTTKNSQSAIDINQKLFNPDFANKQQEYFEEFEEVRHDVETALYIEVERAASISWGEISSPTIPLRAGCIRHYHRDSHRAFKRRRSCGDIQDRPQHLHPHNSYLHARPADRQAEREHASDRLGKACGGTPLSKSKSDHPKVYFRRKDEHWRRPIVERAMSIENTVPPEQHQKEQLLHSEKAGETKDSSDATNDTNVYDTTLGRKIRSRRRPARQVSEKKFEESNGSEAAGIESTCVPSHPYRHRDHNKETEEESLVSSSFSHDNGFGCDDINEKSGTSMINVKVETGSSKSNTRGGDLRELWEQAQQVTTDDLKSTANRRFLHSVVYRHRMGIQFSALRSQIERDIMQDPIKALQKPERALYVDLIIPK